MDEVIVGLDIGSSKVCAVVGFQNENGAVEVAGVGTAPSKGLKNGVIINIDSTVQSIAKAVEDAELMAGCEVGSVYANISGLHTKGENSRGVVAVTSRNRTISHAEIKRVVEAAQAVVIPADREIIHVLSKEFAVDDQTGIKDPIGMSGVRLEAEVHIVTASSASIQNIAKSVTRAGLQCNDMIFSPLASAEAVLTRDEKELGVAVVDIGGGKTDIIVYSEGGVAYSAVIGQGGMHVTSDISIMLRTPLESAEVTKKKHGCALVELVDPSETIDIPMVGGRAPQRKFRSELAQIIEPRMMEIMEHVDHELLKSGHKDLIAAGVVFTGGGAMLEGCAEAAERKLGLPVRIGVARDISGLRDVVATPQYACGVGLLKYGIRSAQYMKERGARPKKGPGFFGSIRRWIEEYL
jgi:cell division protein FtsA